MPWPCRMIEFSKGMSSADLQIGDMFFYREELYSFEEEGGYSWPRFFAHDKKLSQYYRDHNKAKRPPLLVWMPGRVLFCVDSMCWDQAGYHGGWEVTGDPPFITVRPSIDMVGIYHGYIDNGVISDDKEGRVYDAEGKQVIR